MKRWLTIGVSGATCSGKTTLTRRLAEVIPGLVNIGQDKYFWDDDSPNHIYLEQFHHNDYDVVSSVNFEGLLNEANECLSREPKDKVGVLIIEGILVLNYRPVANICERKYFLTLPKEECTRRRELRTYDPPDVPGYFEDCVWPAYEKYSAEVKRDFPDTVFLDGTLSKETIFERVLTDIREMMNRHASS